MSLPDQFSEYCHGWEPVERAFSRQLPIGEHRAEKGFVPACSVYPGVSLLPTLAQPPSRRKEVIVALFSFIPGVFGSCPGMASGTEFGLHFLSQGTVDPIWNPKTNWLGILLPK